MTLSHAEKRKHGQLSISLPVSLSLSLYERIFGASGFSVTNLPRWGIVMGWSMFGATLAVALRIPVDTKCQSLGHFQVSANF